MHEQKTGPGGRRGRAGRRRRRIPAYAKLAETFRQGTVQERSRIFNLWKRPRRMPGLKAEISYTVAAGPSRRPAKVRSRKSRLESGRLTKRSKTERRGPARVAEIVLCWTARPIFKAESGGPVGGQLRVSTDNTRSRQELAEVKGPRFYYILK